MTKPANTDSIETSTGKSWALWVSELNKAGANELPHLELAKLVFEELDGKVDSPSWWAQAVTVAYEQHIGRRIPGQLANGLFEIAVSKTIHKSRAKLFSEVTSKFEGLEEINGHKHLKPRSTETPKRSNWRCDFADGSKFAATVEGDEKKSKLVFSHTALPSKTSAEEWREFWREYIGYFTELE